MGNQKPTTAENAANKSISPQKRDYSACSSLPFLEPLPHLYNKNPIYSTTQNGPKHELNQQLVAELMAPKSQKTNSRPNPPSPSASKSSNPPIHTHDPAGDLNRTLGRDALGVYITHPESFPSSRVVWYDDSFVAIHDVFPKSSVHMLLLPRDAARSKLHPFDAFADADFLARAKVQVEKLERLVASELRRRYGSRSATESARNDALALDPPPDELPAGRDWSAEVMSGVHAGPSMNHLHVHVMSVDRRSECVKHRKHYNSFATPFFVPLKDMPLAKDDARRHPGREGYLSRDLVCWRCGRNFGNKFKQLKEHLEDEFESFVKT